MRMFHCQTKFSKLIQICDGQTVKPSNSVLSDVKLLDVRACDAKAGQGGFSWNMF